MPNYKITIQYDGTSFYGWQSQPSGNTIQDYIFESILKVTKEEVNLIGSGRTDSGVHAFGQVANFRLSDSIDRFKFRHSINSILPSSIFIKSLELVDDEFHARFDAKRRNYLYFVSKDKSPFYGKYSYKFPQVFKKNVSELNTLSKILLGTNDFTSFCKAKTETSNKICVINNIHWRLSKELLIFYIESNRFLHGMVRSIVGTIFIGAQKDNGFEYLKDVVKLRDRNAAGESVPAKGLFLNSVHY